MKYVKQPKAWLELSYQVWKSKAFISERLNRYGESIEAHKKVVELKEKGAYSNEFPRWRLTTTDN